VFVAVGCGVLVEVGWLAAVEHATDAKTSIKTRDKKGFRFLRCIYPPRDDRVLLNSGNTIWYFLSRTGYKAFGFNLQDQQGLKSFIKRLFVTQISDRKKTKARKTKNNFKMA
jgi:hypothetical protein